MNKVVVGMPELKKLARGEEGEGLSRLGSREGVAGGKHGICALGRWGITPLGLELP